MKNINKIIISISLLAAPVAFGCPACEAKKMNNNAPMNAPMSRSMDSDDMDMNSMDDSDYSSMNNNSWMERDRSMKRNQSMNQRPMRSPASRYQSNRSMNDTDNSYNSDTFDNNSYSNSSMNNNSWMERDRAMRRNRSMNQMPMRSPSSRPHTNRPMMGTNSYDADASYNSDSSFDNNPYPHEVPSTAHSPTAISGHGSM
ncbi:hypothetical protein AYO37_00720 [Opitutia bacterium SCGC AG-212-L18]|nr:hypothetical protein AYO37_00720 [Opitutae bacterium SCGC AG-212-L18]